MFKGPADKVKRPQEKVTKTEKELHSEKARNEGFRKKDLVKEVNGKNVDINEFFAEACDLEEHGYNKTIEIDIFQRKSSDEPVIPE